MTKRWYLSAVAVLIAFSALSGGTASAEPSTPVPPPPSTSTPDELADMVMDAIGHGSPAPATTPVPAPHK
ncbi:MULTISPECIES: hypothetical protein [unclassified Mycobacterium]|uniref:hypothetical protein n=1 Tax=unclassified Mycobacterium TaxID=2642494 RepID=UPI0029C79302|nr:MULTISPECIES: hypothetical protein [unclassified Mycobacterium]